MTKSRHIRLPRRPWTESERTIVRDLYPDIPCTDVAALLERSARGIYQEARELNLKKSEYFNASDMSRRIQRGTHDPRMVGTRFKPGIVPWNKGTHFVSGGRSHETRFKPGRLAHEARNYAPIGSLRISKDSYLERKITDDPALAPSRRWTAVHRLVWIAANGPIPAGHIVTFLPGCKSNVLELITADKVECISRRELAARNHPNRSNPELAKLVQLKGAITHQVNRIQRESRA